jgi:uncharacterized membrane protein YccC
MSTATLKQAIRTGVAGGLAMFLSKYLDLPEGYWAAISAVIVMQSSVGATLRDSWVRLAGTAIGSVISIPFLYFWGGNVVAFGAAVTITVLVCGSLKLEASYRLACATVAIIMLIGHTSPSWVVATHRFLEVALGIVVSIAVTNVLWPARASKKLASGIAVALRQLHSIYEAVIGRFRGLQTAPIESLRAEFDRARRLNEDLQEQEKYEIAVPSGRAAVLGLIMAHTDRINRAIEALELATQEVSTDSFHNHMEPELGALADGIGSGLTRVAEGASAQRFAEPEIDFKQLIVALELKAAGVRTTRASEKFELPEILRFHTFFLGLLNLARELDEMQSCARRLSDQKNGPG